MDMIMIGRKKRQQKVKGSHPPHWLTATRAGWSAGKSDRRL